MRTDPPPSFAPAAGTMPAATAAPEPPDEPPGVWARFHGLRARPSRSSSVMPFAPNSGVLVLPKTTSPASRKRCVTSACSSATSSTSACEPLVVGNPAYSCARSVTRRRRASARGGARAPSRGRARPRRGRCGSAARASATSSRPFPPRCGPRRGGPGVDPAVGCKARDHLLAAAAEHDARHCALASASSTWSLRAGRGTGGSAPSRGGGPSTGRRRARPDRRRWTCHGGSPVGTPARCSEATCSPGQPRPPHREDCTTRAAGGSHFAPARRGAHRVRRALPRRPHSPDRRRHATSGDHAGRATSRRARHRAADDGTA